MELNLRSFEILLLQNAGLKSELDETRQVVANQNLEIEEIRRANQAQNLLLEDAQAKVAKLTEEVERLRALEANPGSNGSTTQLETQAPVGPPRRGRKKRRLSPPPAIRNIGASGQENNVPPQASTTAIATKRPRPEVVIIQKPLPAKVFTVPDTFPDEAPLPPRRKIAPLPRAAPLETISVIRTSQSTPGPSSSRGRPARSVSQGRKVKVEKVGNDLPSLNHPASAPPARAPASPPAPAPPAADAQDIKPNKRRKKAKDSDNKLPPDVLAEYLATTITYEIFPAPSDLLVPRKFLRLAYGGSDQHMVQRIQSSRNPSGNGDREVMFPNFEMHPAAPGLPGVPGLYFEFFRVNTRHETPYSLFCKPNPAKAVWMYVGEYKNQECEVLTPEKFQAQRPPLKAYWGKWILEHKSAAGVRARIALRKTAAMPDEGPLRVQKINDEEAAIQAGRGVPLEEQDVISAFENGDEHIYVVRMQCIGYDHVFIQDIETKWLTYDDLCAQDEKAKQAKPQARKGSVRSTPKGGIDAEATPDAQPMVTQGDEGTQDTDGT